MAEIPAKDLVRQYCLVEDEIRAALDRTLSIGEYAPGPAVAAFEREYATVRGAKHCVGVANGTAAVHLAVAACGVGPGDEVITTAHTYVGTAFAVSYTGAKPVFVDIEPVSCNMEVSKVEEVITPRTRASPRYTCTASQSTWIFSSRSRAGAPYGSSKMHHRAMLQRTRDARLVRSVT